MRPSSPGGQHGALPAVVEGSSSTVSLSLASLSSRSSSPSEVSAAQSQPVCPPTFLQYEVRSGRHAVAEDSSGATDEDMMQKAMRHNAEKSRLCWLSANVSVFSVCGHLFSGWRITTCLRRSVHSWRLRGGYFFPTWVAA
jgi:hypothetical protein